MIVSLSLYFYTVSHSLVDLSSGSKRAIQEISGGPLDDVSNGNAANDDWIDDGPFDDNFEVLAEGGEAEYLQEYAGR